MSSPDFREVEQQGPYPPQSAQPPKEYLQGIVERVTYHAELGAVGENKT